MIDNKTNFDIISVETDNTLESYIDDKNNSKKTNTIRRKRVSTKKAVKTKIAVYFEYLGMQVTSDELVQKAKNKSKTNDPKNINIYVKPEDNMVYYVVDDNSGNFELIEH